MGRNSQDTLLDDFSAIQALSSSDYQSTQEDTEGLVEALQNAVEGASGTVRPPATSNSQSESGGAGGSTVLNVLESGFGLGGLIGGLEGLFGGGGSSSQPELQKYAMPTPVDVETSWSPSGLAGGDSDQYGLPRAYGDSSASLSDVWSAYDGGGSTVGDPSPTISNVPAQSQGMATGPTPPDAPSQQSGAGAAAQITVNVQALDAQSLMDRSSDIAAAVRNAMLNLNPINDVVNDL